jgi:beta-galactosidase
MSSSARAARARARRILQRGRVWFCCVVAACAFASLASAAAAQSPPRARVSFNAGWRFQKDDPPGAEGRLSYEKIKSKVTKTGGEFVAAAAAATKPASADESPGSDVAYTRRDFDDSAWRRLDLPHDWGVEGPFKQEYPGETGKLAWWGVGWYRKHFDVPAGDRGRRLYLDLDGAMSYATVWLNGRFVGGWPYGYASFRLDLTPLVEYGAENVLAVRLDNPPDSSRWYPGGGIYRNVWLVKTAPVHVGHWGTYVTTPEVTPQAATVSVKVTLDNDSDAAADVTTRTRVYELGASGSKAAQPVAVGEPSRFRLAARSSAASAASVRVVSPKLWSTWRPSLYAAVTTVEQGGKTVDVYETVFGIRTVKFDAARGFLLNGEPVELKGVCNHHDLGALGAALNVRALERQLEIMKEMGVNAIRTSHNPPAPELLDLADRMGLLVMDEAFDAWRRAKKKNDYHLLFDDWHEKDLRALVRRDRNHPSVILWSTGNEIGEQRSAEGHKVSEALARIVRAEDPTRPVTAGANYTEAGYNGFQQTVDVFGYNYKPGEYGKFRERNPPIPLFASETASTVSSRGEYFFPVEEDKDKGKSDFQVSSYDLYAPRWATTPDAEFKGQDEFPFTAGEFVWTGFDYLGEPTPYNNDVTNLLNFSDPAERVRMEAELKALGRLRVPARSSYFGIVDLAGFKKDRFYIYQARWRPELPMTHILPHWNWPGREGQVTPVYVYTSGDEAELFLNGRTLGRKRRGAFEYRLRWDDVRYEPGELRVVAYKNGKRWADDVVRTTERAARLTLKADHNVIKADGSDLSFITVSVTDTAGLLVPRSKNRIHFEIYGPGEIVAVDNGDATSHESFQSKERAAYNGLCLVVVRSQAGTPGSIKLRAYSEGLKAGVVTIRSARPTVGKG